MKTLHHLNFERRIRLGFMTLGVIAVALIGCMVGTLLISPAIPTSAENGQKVVYAISYSDVTSDETLGLLEADVGYMRSAGLRFLLPSDLNTFTEGGAVLILELGRDEAVELVISKLKELDVCAVIAVDKTCSKASLDAIREAQDAGRAEPAFVFETCSSEPVDMIAAFAEARMEFFGLYGMESTTYIHKCSERLCTNASVSEERYPENIFIFGYGNGVNQLSLPCGGIVGLSRILRLRDWTIEDYFSSIAR